MTIDIAAFLSDAIKMATPLIFAALAALINRHAGMFNMGVEGMILCSALGAVTAAHFSGSVWIGLLGGILVGVLTGLFIAFAHLTGKTDLYLTCIAFNLMANGGTIFAMYLLTGEKSTTSGAFRSYSIPNLDIPLIKDIPFIGRIISGQSILTYLAFLSVFFVWFLLMKTRIGLRIRSVGENPMAAESVGISVKKIGYIAFLLCGLFCGMAGAFMSMSWVTFFMKNMVAGRGYIGVSAQNMANGSPIGSALVALLFGATNSFTTTLKSQSRFPTEFLEMIPYLSTIFTIIITGIYKINKRRKIEKGQNR
ncbi:MAG: ABC transporter permease [Erysipelotrichaceae bacterium]|nr:ABC transporter permease [Erysipelotrichaceae bacterium]